MMSTEENRFGLPPVTASLLESMLTVDNAGDNMVSNIREAIGRPDLIAAFDSELNRLLNRSPPIDAHNITAQLNELQSMAEMENAFEQVRYSSSQIANANSGIEGSPPVANIHQDINNNSDYMDIRAALIAASAEQLNQQNLEAYALTAFEGVISVHGTLPDGVPGGRGEILQDQKIAETMEQIAAQNPKNLVRGALLRCSCGSHKRYLNLPIHHGVYVRDRPLIHAQDAVPGRNIMWFGLCTAPNPPTGNRIRVADFGLVDQSGYFMHENVDRTGAGSGCQPSIQGGWRNSDERAWLDESAAYAVVTKQSYIMCQHGGVIYPVTSGQEDIFIPAFSHSPFPFDLSENSNFMQWAAEEGINPFLPGMAEFDDWYSRRIQDSTTTLGESRLRVEQYEEEFANITHVSEGDLFGSGRCESNELHALLNLQRAQEEYRQHIKNRSELYNSWASARYRSGSFNNMLDEQKASTEQMFGLYYPPGHLPGLDEEKERIRTQFGRPIVEEPATEMNRQEPENWNDHIPISPLVQGMMDGTIPLP